MLGGLSPDSGNVEHMCALDRFTSGLEQNAIPPTVLTPNQNHNYCILMIVLRCALRALCNLLARGKMDASLSFIPLALEVTRTQQSFLM